MIDWQIGVKYRISTDNKKQIEKITTYAKVDDYDQKIIHNEAFRSGWVEVLGDDMSYYLDDSYEPEIGTDVWIFPTEDHEILDGVADDFSFSENVPEDEQEKYPDPTNPGTFYKYKMDMKNMKRFDKLNFMDAAEELGMIGDKNLNEK